jgi:ribosomal protein S15P/S13E
LSSYETTTNGPTGAEQDTGKAQEAAKVAQEKAQEAKGKARNRFSSEVDTRSTQAGEQAESVAQDVRSVGEHLRSEGKDKSAEFAEKAAARVAELSDYLKRSDGDAILRDAERLGRDKPWAVMAGGIALGIVASRFLKASSSRRYHELESSSNLPARRADVDRAAISPATGPATGATSETPGTAPTPDATRPVPGAPERELSLTGGVLPPRPAGAGQ